MPAGLVPPAERHSRSADRRLHQDRPDREPLSARGRPAARMDSAAVPEFDGRGRGDCTGPPVGSATSPGSSTPTIAPRRHSPAACGCRLAAITHPERVFVASVLHTRYGGATDDPVREPTRALLDPQAAGEVRTLGLALRLAYALTGGRIELLAETWLGRDRGSLVLEVPASGRPLRRRDRAAPPRCRRAVDRRRRDRPAPRAAPPCRRLRRKPLVICADGRIVRRTAGHGR